MLPEQNEFVPQNYGENDRDYELFINYCKSNKNLKEFSKDLDISLGYLYAISRENNWKKRRQIWRESYKLQNIADNQFFMELNNNNLVESLVDLNNKISEKLLEDVSQYEADPNEISKRLGANMKTLSESVRLSRLICNMSDKNVALDNIITQLDVEEDNPNEIYKDWGDLLEGENNNGNEETEEE